MVFPMDPLEAKSLDPLHVVTKDLPDVNPLLDPVPIKEVVDLHPVHSRFQRSEIF